MSNVVLLQRAKPRVTCHPLSRADIDELQFRSTTEEKLVRDSLALLLEQPQWCYAGRLDGRLAMIGGFVWSGPHWCHAALAPAAWLRPMHWRHLLPGIVSLIERARGAGATRIEALVNGRQHGVHRLMMALGFDFQGLQIGRDGKAIPWVVYAIAPTPPIEIGLAMAEAHLRVLGALGDP